LDEEDSEIIKTKCIVTAEEHILEVESISRVLALNNPALKSLLLLMTVSGESGTPAQLMEKYKLNNQAIVEAVERVIKDNLLICKIVK
jgi:transketolase